VNLERDHDGSLRLGAILRNLVLRPEVYDAIAPSQMHPDWDWDKFAYFALWLRFSYKTHEIHLLIFGLEDRTHNG
jgi:hypothetical protein